jgi:hypothetical protein
MLEHIVKERARPRALSSSEALIDWSSTYRVSYVRLAAAIFDAYLEMNAARHSVAVE